MESRPQFAGFILQPKPCSGNAKARQALALLDLARVGKHPLQAEAKAAPKAETKAAKPKDPDVEYVRGFPDKQTVADTRRDLCKDKDPLDLADVRKLAAALRSNQPPVTVPAEREAGDDFDPSNPLA